MPPLNRSPATLRNSNIPRFLTTRRRLLAAVVLCLALIPGQGQGAEPAELPPAAEQEVNYRRDIQPILARHCLNCHGPDEQESSFRVDLRKVLLTGGDYSEPAIVPGKSAESVLVRRLASSDESFVMPPAGEGKQVSAEDIGLLRAWIDQGATMPAGSGAALATEHWSFQPVERPEPPALEDAFIANPIDAFILERLRQAGLSPSPPASRRELIRRIYLDMLGLLPTPTEVTAFEADTSPDAYQQLVEDVLASQHYGERWARHWLDVVRFAESNGFETNHERPNAYHYRDWVIRALNEDMPYDEFIFNQLAGDQTGEDAATGFLVGGAYDKVRSPDPQLTLMQRQDELADMSNTTGTAFLGLTVGCARCHTHKFDPILQKDYYSLQAVFAGVQHGDRQMKLPPEKEAQRAEQTKQVSQQIAKLQRQLAALEPPPFDGQILLIDDEDSQRVDMLADKGGHGENPAGRSRGQEDDPGGAARLPNISGGRYTWWQNQPGVDLLAYRPQAAGRWRLWLSWGCGHDTHSADAQYLLDRDGNPATTDDQTILATVDQRRFADGQGKPNGQSLWSGFYNAGWHELSTESAILLRGGDQGTAVTSDVLLLEGPGIAAPAADTIVDKTTNNATVPRLLPAVGAKQNEDRFTAVAARFVRFTVEATNSAEPCLDELEIWTTGQQPTNVALATAGAKVTSSGNYAGNPKHKLEHVNDGQYGNDRSWISNTAGSGWVEIELPSETIIDRVVWGRDRMLQYEDRLAIAYRIEVATKPGQWQTVADQRRRIPYGSGSSDAVVYRTLGLPPEDAAKVRSIAEEISRLEARRKQLAARPTVYAGRFVEPPATHRLYRGDPMAPREQVAPEALTVLLPEIGSLELAAGAPEVERRAALAHWIASPENPLTARVIVNRLWHYHFGRGIVATPSDFGAMGFKPTHPRLLDWLAAELIEPTAGQPWSLKQIHRLILMSSTYRQAGKPNAAGLKQDRDATLLWRFPPRRLEAEAVRDNILLIAGTLDETMYGPGFMMFVPNSNYSRNWIAKDEFGPAEFRRMVYALDLRMENDAVFGAFDCPDGGQVTPRRTRSTTPIQALNLFNSDFVLQQAEAFAQRVTGDVGAEPEAQVRRVFQLILLRQPTDAERNDAAALVRDHGLVALCRAMFNSNEFLFLR